MPIKMNDELKKNILSGIDGFENESFMFDGMELSCVDGVAKAMFFYKGREMFSLFSDAEIKRFKVKGVIPVSIA